MHVSISRANSKMGAIPSVSLPSIMTCIICDCNNKCYARKFERLRPTVKNAYMRNFQVLREDPDTYWREVKAHVMLSGFFRFHVSGDIPDDDYFKHMIQIAEECPHCTILCFTKKYGIVNTYLCNGGVIPTNLKIIFSGWIGLKMCNPFSLPEAHVRYKDGSTTAGADAKECSGNCAACAITDGGCWALKSGEQVIFNEH